MPEETAFNNVETNKKFKAVPRPDKLTTIDTKNSLYDNIIEASTNSTIDLNAINSFTSVSQARNNVYNMIDVMCEDPVISTALNIYASDVCEPNDSGDIIWVESDNPNVLKVVTTMLNTMGVNKHAYGWAYSLIKYGDLYLKLYRKSDVGEYTPSDKTLNEDVKINAYRIDDHYTEFVEANKNPAEVFDLQQFGKTVGYIKTQVPLQDSNNDKTFLYKYNFNKGDVDLYPGTSYVHACLEDYSSRTSEEVSISSDTDDEVKTNVYSVRRGQSILYNVFRVWRELSLLENSVILNRITRSALTRIVTVEVGDMEKTEAKTLLHRMKSMIEQKAAVNVGKSYEDYTNPGPVENVIYVPKHGDVGGISVQDLGGNVDQGDLVDLDYFRNKVCSALGIPKPFLGLTDDASGFSAGESLALISANYGKTVKKLQNALRQAIKDAINLFLIDRGLIEYVNEFTIKMQAPTTKEEKDRRENLSTAISNIRDTIGLFESDIDNKATKLTIVKSMLAGVINNEDVLASIQAEIDKDLEEQAEEQADEMPAENFESHSSPMGGADDIEEPIDEAPIEDETLPSFNDLGISYNET